MPALIDDWRMLPIKPWSNLDCHVEHTTSERIVVRSASVRPATVPLVYNSYAKIKIAEPLLNTVLKKNFLFL